MTIDYKPNDALKAMALSGDQVGLMAYCGQFVAETEEQYQEMLKRHEPGNAFSPVPIRGIGLSKGWSA